MEDIDQWGVSIVGDVHIPDLSPFAKYVTEHYTDLATVPHHYCITQKMTEIILSIPQIFSYGIKIFTDVTKCLTLHASPDNLDIFQNILGQGDENQWQPSGGARVGKTANRRPEIDSIEDINYLYVKILHQVNTSSHGPFIYSG